MGLQTDRAVQAAKKDAADPVIEHRIMYDIVNRGVLFTPFRDMPFPFWLLGLNRTSMQLCPHDDMMLHMLRLKSDPNLQDTLGFTALHQWSKYGSGGMFPENLKQERMNVLLTMG